MSLNWLDRIGDWNPQLFREFKSRLKSRNVAIAVASSLFGQLLLFLYWVNQQPNIKHVARSDIYCIASLREPFIAAQNQNIKLYSQYRQLQFDLKLYSSPQHYDPEKLQQLKATIEEVKEKIQHVRAILNDYYCPSDAFDYRLWWHEQYPQIFMLLSVFVLLIVLIAGTYMLISNLAHEERRGTLNFLRLTPQSALSILVGKLLGVPILLYLAAVLTIPLHLWLGFSAQMPGFEILVFYAVLISSCAFFYSAALLFGLVTSWLGGFQAWLGSGAVLTFLWMINFKAIAHSPMDWLHLFSLVAKLPYLQSHINDLGGDYISPVETIQELKWFDLPIGATRISLVIFALLHYALWTGWIWQALNRQFHNPNATIISKRQSYWLVACFEAVVLGFVSLEEPQEYYDLSEILRNPAWLAIFNGVLFLGLIAVLAPQRQALQDWARYRREKVAKRKGFWNRALVQDLLVGEKSPELLAMAVNLAIAITPFLLWIVFVPNDVIDQTKALLAVAFFVSLIMIYSTIAQLMLMMKTNKRSLWAAGTIAALVVVPPLSFSILSVDTVEQPALWLFSTFPWAGIEHGATTTIGMALLLQCCVLILLNFQLTRQLRRAGESASNALLAERPALPN